MECDQENTGNWYTLVFLFQWQNRPNISSSLKAKIYSKVSFFISLLPVPVCVMPETANTQNPSGRWKRNEYQFPTVLWFFPKSWFGFYKLSMLNIVTCWLDQDLKSNYLPHQHTSRDHNCFLHSSLWVCFSCKLIHLHFSLALKWSRMGQRIHNYKTVLWLHKPFSPHAHTN